MSEVKTLNVAQQLKGMAVLVTTTGEKLGEVTDAIIHPIEGRVLGITIGWKQSKYDWGLLQGLWRASPAR